MLVCPVRECRLPLRRETARVICERGHSFDISRSGYINLLQSQDRRSAQPGDTLRAVRSRRRLHDSGATNPLLEEIARLLAASKGEHVLDAGCGDGFYIGNMSQSGALGHGIDISTPAVDAAARRYPDCEWVVGNADRFLPYASQSFPAVLSVTARRNPREFARVIQDNGRLLVAVPAPDDLIELRGPSARDRVPGTIQEFDGVFRLEDYRRVTTAADLDAAAIEDLRHSIYRPFSQVQNGMRVTFSLDLLLFRPIN